MIKRFQTITGQPAADGVAMGTAVMPPVPSEIVNNVEARVAATYTIQDFESRRTQDARATPWVSAADPETYD